MEVFFIYIFFAILMGVLGSDKNLGFWGAFVISLLLSPLIGLIFVLTSASKKQEETPQAVHAQQSPINQDRPAPSAKENTPIVNPVNQSTYIDSLHKLKELYESKLISLAEFEKEKQILQRQREVDDLGTK